jgi:hypothetical protein
VQRSAKREDFSNKPKHLDQHIGQKLPNSVLEKNPKLSDEIAVVIANMLGTGRHI